MDIEFLDSPFFEPSFVTEDSYSPYEASLFTSFAPFTSPPASPKTEVCRQECEGLFSFPFSPASLDDPTRNGPSLPKALPQLPENATPLEVAEVVRTSFIYRDDNKAHGVQCRTARHQITGLKECAASTSCERTLTNHPPESRPCPADREAPFQL